MTTYRVVILDLKPGQTRDEALQRLAAIFKQPFARLSTLLAGARTVVKRGADLALAAKMQAAIEATGFECVVEPEVSDGGPFEVNGQAAHVGLSPKAAEQQASPPSANSNPIDAGPSPNLGGQPAPVNKWIFLRHVTRDFGWGHWAAVGFLVLGAVVAVVDIVESLSGGTEANVVNAAERGNAAAQDKLGIRYANGKGVPKDYVKAAAWFRKAAEQGDADAQDNLGFEYATGNGVEQDYVKAAAWYRKAAEQGNAEAQKALEIMASNGSQATTAAGAYQAMERHQNACQVQGNIACIAVCEKTKEALAHLAQQLSLNPQLPIPPQFLGAVNNFERLCTGQGR